MSTSEAPETDNGFAALSQAVTRALARIRELEGELKRTRARRDEVEALLQRMTAGEENPAHMAQRLKKLDRENGELRSRLGSGREIADRLLARVRYLQEHD